VQAWLGHADLATTARYLHTASRTAGAELLGRALPANTPAELIEAG
jgi:integrase